MPELPEVENLRRSLESGLLGARVGTVLLARTDIVHGWSDRKRIETGDLLGGCSIASLDRRGKQLAIIGDRGSGLVVHLGMSGQLRWGSGEDSAGLHVHARWGILDSLGARRTLEFRDPRRFGGLFPFRSRTDLESRLWADLGPDAVGEPLDSLSAHLRTAFRSSRRAIKSVLLDQSVIAGIGNIYADEALFAAGIDPRCRADRLAASRSDRLAEEIQRVLRAAIDAGGTTLRDYVDASGRSGSFQSLHAVYGRAGLGCRLCSAILRSGLVSGRTTVWCPSCQSRSRSRGPDRGSCT